MIKDYIKYLEMPDIKTMIWNHRDQVPEEQLLEYLKLIKKGQNERRNRRSKNRI